MPTLYRQFFHRGALVVVGLLAACHSNDKTVTASCTDGVKNGSETDVDCGGSCAPCSSGKACLSGADCADGACLETHTCDCICNLNTATCGSCADGCKCGVNRGHAGECWWSGAQGSLAGGGTVQVLGLGSALSTNGSAGFTLPGGPPSFTIAAAHAEGGVTWAAVYDLEVPVGEALNGLNLSVLGPVAPAGNDKQGTITIDLVGGESPASPGTITIPLIISAQDPQVAADAAAHAAVTGPLPAPWVLPAHWQAPATTSTSLYVLQVTAAGVQYDSRTLLGELADGSDTPVTVHLTAMTTGAAPVIFEPPTGYGVSTVRRFTDTAGAWLGPETVDAAVAGQPGHFTIASRAGPNSLAQTAVCFAYEDPVSGGHGESCYCGPPLGTDTTVPGLAAPLLRTPADGATGFNPMTQPLTYDDVGAAYYVVTVEAASAAEPWSIQIFTAATSVLVPDLSALGVTIAPHTPVDWSVVAHGPNGYAASVGTLSKVLLAPRVPEAHGCYRGGLLFPLPSSAVVTATSPARTFTTP